MSNTTPAAEAADTTDLRAAPSTPSTPEHYCADAHSSGCYDEACPGCAQPSPPSGAPVEGVHANMRGAKCPITGRSYFMTLDHPDLGMVPTYGGPYDSYTVPALEGEPTDKWHEREMRCEMFDHDEGAWVEGGEPVPLRLIHEPELDKLLGATERAAKQAVPGLRGALNSLVAAAEFAGIEDANERAEVRKALESARIVLAAPSGEVAAPAMPAQQPECLWDGQEPKYTVNGSSIVNRATGAAIPADEPVFVFRARDVHAVNVLSAYARDVRDKAHAAAVWARVAAFKRFWDEHPDRMKAPDTAGFAATPVRDAEGEVAAPAERPASEYPALPEAAVLQIAEVREDEHGTSIVGWRTEESVGSFAASMRPKRKLYTAEQMDTHADATVALRASRSQEAEGEVEPALFVLWRETTGFIPGSAGRTLDECLASAREAAQAEGMSLEWVLGRWRPRALYVHPAQDGKEVVLIDGVKHEVPSAADIELLMRDIEVKEAANAAHDIVTAEQAQEGIGE